VDAYIQNDYADNIMSGQPGTKGLYCGREVRIAQDGKAVEMAADGTLAGSCASLWQSFLYLRQGLQLPLVDVVTMLSQTPARIAR
jgi:N-acetylglucosamine-6-phosphate deacetylase